MQLSISTLIEKYDVPAPRYTSYPTVPYWDSAGFNTSQWREAVLKGFKKHKEEGISLYIHLPYCEQLCTYCGCNTRITVNHGVERPYLDALLKEWKSYLELFGEKPLINEIHLGGGTPTFFSPGHLEFLIRSLLENAIAGPNLQISVEGHPNNTTWEHLVVLRKVGAKRLSLGVQDLDPKVQEVINRIQPFENVERVCSEARSLGFESINIDLVYGLPLQTLKSVQYTLSKVISLRPERIAFYSYAHVPWIKPGQRKFTELDLPSGKEKRQLYETGRAMLLKDGYEEIGMDHFARPHDALAKALKEKSLHRNFMGYVPYAGAFLLGLGASSISDTGEAFGQNIKNIEDYVSAVGKGEWPITRGHLLNGEDLVLRRHILNLMCKGETLLSDNDFHEVPYLYEALTYLSEPEKDGLVERSDYTIRIVPEAKPFMRNICMCLDARLMRQRSADNLFSKSI